MTGRSLWVRLAPRSRAGLIGQLGLARSKVASLTALRERDGNMLAQTAEALRGRIAEADQVRAAVAGYGHASGGFLPGIVIDALGTVTTRMHRAEGELAVIRAELRDGWRPVPDGHDEVRAAVTEVLAEVARDRGDDLHAELLAVDEALAEAGATPADDRVGAIRELATARREAGELAQAYRRARRPVNGDVLRDAITDAVPRTITDDAARAHADQVLDGLVASGMTVRQGPDGTPRSAKPAPATDDGVVDAHIYDAAALRGDGGFVCGACGISVESGPCPEHQPDAFAAFHAESVPWERTVSIGWAAPGVDRSGS